MKKAEIPDDEIQRLEELSALHILDTEPEQSFDDLTLIASNICGAPIALVSLVDQNRQWFKSRQGLDATETARDISFCGHAIHGTNVFEVPDSLADERFKDNPLVTGGPLVRFYAGAPLISKNGHALGTLCVIDHNPLQLSDYQKSSLEALARQVVRLFELRQARYISERELELAKNREVDIKILARQLGDAQKLAKIGSWEFNLVTMTQTWSQEHYNIFEIEAPQESQALYQLYRNRIHPEDLIKLDAIIERLRVSGSDEAFLFDHRAIFEGSRRVKYLRGMGHLSINERGERILQGTCQDRSAEIALNESLEVERAKSIQSSKLASLGEMAAGVAHEINNPLSIIRATLQMIEQQPEATEKFGRRIQSVIHATRRIEKIVGGLRTFSRSSERGMRVKRSIKDVLEEVLVLVNAKSVLYNVPVRIASIQDYEVLCNDIELEQVLINIINNGMFAAKDQDEQWVEIGVDAIDSSLRIQIRDSGTGIKEEVMNKLFDPFFTTKAVNEGTGLGLSIAKGIVEDHGGNIRVVLDSSHTCFEITLPLADAIESVRIAK